MRRPLLGSLSRAALALTLAACTSRTTPAPTAPSPADALVPADAGLGAAPRKTGRHGGTAAGDPAPHLPAALPPCRLFRKP